MKSRLKLPVVLALAFIMIGLNPGQAAQVVPVAQPFDLSQVRLLVGPFQDAQRLDAKYLLSLDPDRLLHAFRLNAGFPSTAQPLGGWEAPNCELRGHFVGHYLSACSLMYQSTGDVQFKQRVDYLVAELAKCQQALGGQYLSAFPSSFFDRLEQGKNVWAPYYTIHKIMAGLLDANQRCGNAQALSVLKGMSAYFKQRTDKLDPAQMAVVMNTEFGGMMEVTANLYAVTGNPDDLALSERFDHHAVFDPLAARQDKLTGLHANTQIPKITGAARLYELTGDERYHSIADYFWEEVTGHRSFVTGGNSFGEYFRAPGVEAGELIPTTSESCNTYNMLKLTRQLFGWKPDARYADYYERALYNHILSSIDPDSGMMLYFLSLKPGHFKVYNTPTNSFWCCTGTGTENHAKYGDSIYFHNDTSLWVNLFIPSELNWSDKGIVVLQETQFPVEQATTLTMKVSKPTQLALQLRVPCWATSGIAVKVNGNTIDTGNAQCASYFTVDRVWADGDRVEYSLPMKLHLYRASDLPNNVAILYGPIVLSGELGKQGIPPSDQAHDQNDLGKVPAPVVPFLVTDNPDPATWCVPVPGKPLEFRTNGVGKPADVTLLPLYQINHQRYTVYWKLLGTKEAAAQ
jgi:hypothetical protein